MRHGKPAPRRLLARPLVEHIYVDPAITFLRAGEWDRAIGSSWRLGPPAAALPTPDWDGASPPSVRRPRDPKRAEAYNVLGLLLGRKGAKSDDVAAAFREAIRLRPDSRKPTITLDSSCSRRVMTKAASRHCERPSGSHRLRGRRCESGWRRSPQPTPTPPSRAREGRGAGAVSVKAKFNLGVAYAASPFRRPAKAIEQLRAV